MTLTDIMLRIGFAASLAVSAFSHAYLYVHGYQHIPRIGAAFLLQASICFAVALLILLGGPGWLRWAAAAVAGGSLVAFVLSRTVGLLGFAERGWEPSPHAAVTVGAELLTVLLWMISDRTAAARLVRISVGRLRQGRFRLRGKGVGVAPVK
jgi:hypothetical protein